MIESIISLNKLKKKEAQIVTLFISCSFII